MSKQTENILIIVAVVVAAWWLLKSYSASTAGVSNAYSSSDVSSGSAYTDIAESLLTDWS